MKTKLYTKALITMLLFSAWSLQAQEVIIGFSDFFVFDTRIESLGGTITNASDETGIQGASITLTGASNSYSATSQADGSYLMGNVPAGSYNMTVTRAGFQTHTGNVQVSGDPDQVIDVALVPSESDMLVINSNLTAYADNIVENPTNVFTLSGNVNINNLLSFDGIVYIDKLPINNYSRVWGNCGFYATNIGEHATYWIKQSNVPFQFNADGNSLIQSEWSTALETIYNIGGFKTTIGQIDIDPDGDFVEVKSVAVMPFPVDQIAVYLLQTLETKNFIEKMSSSKILSRQNGVGIAVDINDVGVNLGFVSLEDVSLYFNSNTQVYGGGFKLDIPGSFGGSKDREDWDEEWMAFMDKMHMVPVEVWDENLEQADSLSFDEFVDRYGERAFKLLSLGAEIEFVQGSINKIIVSIGARVPLGPTGLFLTRVTGGLDDLATENWKIIANVDIDLGVEVPALGSPVKIEEFGVEIQPWEVFKGGGSFLVFNKPVADGYIEFNQPLSLLHAESTLSLGGLIHGRNYLSLRGNQISGSGLLEVKTPPKDDLFWPIRKLGNITLSFAQVDFNNELIQAELSTWISLAMKMEFGNPDFPWFHYYLGFNLNRMWQIWKGRIEGKNAITFQVPENTGQLVVAATDTINPTGPYDFSIMHIATGQIFDKNNAYYHEVGHEESSSLISLLQPMEGDWMFLTDYQGEVALITLGLDQKPATMLEQPGSRRTRSNEISLTINDYADTLNVQVYYNTHNRRFDGRLIDEFTVINNAELNFTWHNQDVPNGEYYIYTRIDDGKNSPVLQYAPGSIWVENDPNIETPENLGTVQQGDSIIVTWNEAQMPNTVAANVYYKDLSTWRTEQKAVSGDNQTVLYDLTPGRGYEIWCRFINENGTYSPKSNIRELVFTSDLRNNSPYFTMDPDSILVFIAGEMAEYTIHANDGDGDPLTFSLLGDTLGIDVIGDKMQWTPTLEQRGVYYQGIVVSDGAETDTTYQQLVVYTPEQVEVKLAYNSVQLYEADNTFLILRNFFSQEPTQTVMLTNLRTGEETTVTCRRVNEFEYMGQFQLSIEKRSEIPVEDGDTIKATSIYDGNTYEALAFYNINQQPSDITPPGDITDLSVEALGDNKVVLYWTASGDDGYEDKAFRYDIRYAYEPIESEGVYFTAYLLQNVPYPSVAGEQDSLVVNLMDLQFIDQHDQVWFSIKAEDAVQNRSGLSNSPDVQTLLQPTNVKASVQDVYNIHLNWQGPQPGDKDGNAFENYTIFRQYNEGSYSVITSQIDALSYTDDLKVRPDGTYRYGIQSVYENGESEIAYSEPVAMQRFVNVNILCNLHGQPNHESIQFEMTALDEIYGQEFSRTTNATGLIMLGNVFKSDYTVEISKEGYASHVEEITVTDSQVGFSFTLYCEPLSPTDLAADDITAFSAMIDWTAGSTESQWDIFYGLEGFDPDSEGTLLENITNKPYLLSGLSPETAYDVYLRAVCGENVSDWSVPLTFTTGEHDIPHDLPLSGVIADGDTECFDALQTITISDFTVEAGGSATLIAGESIHLLPGTAVEHAGYLLARIAANEGDYCGIPRAVEIAKEPVTSKEDDVVSADFNFEIRENGFFKLYPNPTDGTFTLELTTAEIEQTITVEVHSMLGGRLFIRELPPQRLHTLSLEGQQPGMYIIRVMKGDQIGIERLIKR
jgi:hypothetical protein